MNLLVPVLEDIESHSHHRSLRQLAKVLESAQVPLDDLYWVKLQSSFEDAVVAQSGCLVLSF